MTYLDQETSSLVVVLSLDLTQSHAILEEPREIDFFSDVSTTHKMIRKFYPLKVKTVDDLRLLVFFDTIEQRR